MALCLSQFNLKDKKVVIGEELSHIAIISMVGDKEQEMIKAETF